MRLLTLALYNLLLPPALLVAVPSAVRKARRRGNAKKNFFQRLSIYSDATRSQFTEPTDIWIHAVSVGEVLIAKRLIGAILEQAPTTKIALSTTTPTGYAVACEQSPPGIPIIYTPFDLPGVVQRSLALVRPRQVVLIEAEIWPNFLTAAHAAGIPVSVVNARLSPRSARRFIKFRKLVAPIYELLNFVGVQEKEDQANWQQLGVAHDKIKVTGSLKFDPSGNSVSEIPPAIRHRFESIWEPPLITVLAASTHPGEELLIANAVRKVEKKHPSVRLLICPRHVERTPEIIAELEAANYTTERRSSDDRSDSEAPIFLIDSTGELNAWTQLADIVIIGKSFLAEGGQNPAEALAAGKPTITGPHMENFAALVTQLKKADGILTAETPGDLAGTIKLAIGSGTGEKGKAVLESHRGACARTAKHLLTSVEPSPGMR